MADLLYVKIAGVNFTVRSDNLNILQKPDPTYRSFLGKVNSLPGRKPADIQIRLQLGGIPDTNNLKRQVSPWSTSKGTRPPRLDQKNFA